MAFPVKDPDELLDAGVGALHFPPALLLLPVDTAPIDVSSLLAAPEIAVVVLLTFIGSPVETIPCP